MALLKSKADQYGNGGISYWKIIETNINWLTKNSHCTLAGYVNQQARLDNKQPLESQSFDWSGDQFPFSLDVLNQEDENVIKVAYGKIKESKLDENNVEQNWFADAEDL